MSATNWAYCTGCEKKAEKKKQARLAKANEAYGKEPPEVYLAMKADAEKEVELERTLREDYYIGVNDEGFYVQYTGGCEKCGFYHKFTHNEPADFR